MAIEESPGSAGVEKETRLTFRFNSYFKGACLFAYLLRDDGKFLTTPGTLGNLQRALNL
jgi:hypothetical protein